LKILITGGAGFIGSSLAKTMMEKGNNIKILDNLSHSSKKSITNLQNNGVEFCEGDITNFNQTKKAVNDCDVVLHLAAKISVQESISNPQETKKVNVKGTENILRACVETGTTNLIAASSAAVYGIPEKLPLNENSSLRPISPYGQSKVMMEQKIKEYAAKHDFDCIILRIFNAYGSGQSDEYAGVITKFTKSILQNKPLTIFGDGSFSRDFIHISDVVSSFEGAIKNLKRKKGQSYNIASGNQTSIKSLAKLMLKLSGKDLQIIHKPSKKGDIPRSHASIDLAKKELAWMPKISLKEGIRLVLEEARF